jgi:hypothetical protein
LMRTSMEVKSNNWINVYIKLMCYYYMIFSFYVHIRMWLNLLAQKKKKNVPKYFSFFKKVRKALILIFYVWMWEYSFEIVAFVNKIFPEN